MDEDSNFCGQSQTCASKPNNQSTLLLTGSWKTLKKGHECKTKHKKQLGVALRQCALSQSNFNKRIFG